MKIAIITGMSGAGKTLAADALEDMGYFCIDNMPVEFLLKFVELSTQTKSNIANIAVVTDIRSKSDLAGDFFKNLDQLVKQGSEYKILFLDASDQTLISRYKETRRKHPLEDSCGGSLTRAIAKERQMLETIRKRSDFVVDTSNTTGAQLKDRVFKAFTTGESRNITIYITSFGFKHGIPLDSDDVFDVRCFPNPYYDVKLRMLTGLDAPVYDYVFSYPECRVFADKLYDMMLFLIPLYQKEGRNRLIVNIGCTGGHHRSVSFAENLGKRLIEQGYDAIIAHRDINR